MRTFDEVMKDIEGVVSQYVQLYDIHCALNSRLEYLFHEARAEIRDDNKTELDKLYMEIDKSRIGGPRDNQSVGTHFSLNTSLDNSRRWLQQNKENRDVKPPHQYVIKPVAV